METIGKIENGIITKEFYGQGFVYKNFKAFENKTDEVCYVPEFSSDEGDESLEGNSTYTYNDFISIAKEAFKDLGFEGSPETLAKLLFESCNWQSPETLVSEWDTSGEFENYPETHGIKCK